MKFVKEFVVPAAVLTIICVVVSAALVATYNTTAPIIEAAKIAAADAARVEVLAGADSFTQVEVSTEGVTDAYTANNGAGYVITGQSRGYGGMLNVMVGITADGTIEMVKLMDNSETSGLGTKTGDASYTDQYKGKDMSLDGIDAISGATVSSNAFIASVGNAFNAYAEIAGVEVAEVVTTVAITPVDGAATAFASTQKGFIGDVVVNVHFDASGAIVAVVPEVAGETPEYGGQYADDSYTSQWVGKTDVSVDMISGATVTGTAINAGVTEAIAAQKGA